LLNVPGQLLTDSFLVGRNAEGSGEVETGGLAPEQRHRPSNLDQGINALFLRSVDLENAFGLIVIGWVSLLIEPSSEPSPPDTIVIPP
jgi:hypothetical protein